MKTIKLDLDHLKVDSFEVMPEDAGGRGTVRGFAFDAIADPGTVSSPGGTCDPRESCGCPTQAWTCPDTCKWTCDDNTCVDTCVTGPCVCITRPVERDIYA
jgi:hypothetical protein